MRFNILLTASLLNLFVFSSCASSFSTTAQNTFAPEVVVPFNVDDILTTQFMLPTTNLVESFVEAPVLEISGNFSATEKSMVKAPTEGLFNGRNELILDLGRIDQSSFAYPLPHSTISSQYGPRNRKQHTGVDLKPDMKSPTIVSAFDGVVRLARSVKGYGNIVVVRHYNGLETVYAHNSKNLVKAGDKVKAGTPVGVVGRTGTATGIHLHFEVRVNGMCIDPNLVIDFDSQQLQNRALVFTPTAKGVIKVDRV